MNKNQYPVVKCFQVGKIVKFWCPFCKRWHIHGGCDSDDPKIWEGHRVAHCPDQTPFSDNGYILKPYTKKELKEIGVTKCLK